MAQAGLSLRHPCHSLICSFLFPFLVVYKTIKLSMACYIQGTQVSRIADSLPAEPQGKPKNTRVGSLSLLLDLPDPGIKPGSLALQADSLPTELSGKP